MKPIYWFAAAFILAVAAFSIWWAFQNSAVLYGVLAAAMASLAAAFKDRLLPAILKSSPETQAEAKRRTDQGEGPITPRDRPPNVTTGKVTVKPADTNRDHRGESHH